ncbi:MAG TPA: thioredoxin, partial [Porphyromonadaceae bacterium]|nr:thioredoxin [Porphyromonadaceae bacterium]
MKIKLIIAALVTSFMFAACSNNTGKSTSSPQAAVTQQETNLIKTNMTKTIHLTKADFLTKVANYEK